MAAPYILARTFADAHAFARDVLGLGRGHYRVVNSSGTLKAVRGVTLYLVPGWQNRWDRFAMQSALRWTKMNVIDGAEVQAQEPDAEPDGLEPAGFQLTLVGLDEAHDFVTAIDPAITEAVEAAQIDIPGEQADEPVVAGVTGSVLLDPSTDEPVAAPREQAPETKAPKNRRRRRCGDCGTLHFKEDPCIPVEGV